MLCSPREPGARVESGVKLEPQNGYVCEQFVDTCRDVEADRCIALDIDEGLVIDVFRIEALDEMEEMYSPGEELTEILCTELVAGERGQGIDQREDEPDGVDDVDVLKCRLSPARQIVDEFLE